MDYNKIGNFIMSERKAKKLTQSKLAEKLFVSEKTISKWENGNGIPDTNILPQLCEILNITINELLNGERLSSQDYTHKAESKLLELQKSKEENDKMLLRFEIVVGLFSTLLMVSLTLVAAILPMAEWIKIVIIALSLALFLPICFALIKIEQIAGFYECQHCHYKYVPTYKQATFARHIGRSRYMKCPNCHKKSMSKKVLK